MNNTILENITVFKTDSSSVMSFPMEVVTKQDCINYVADTTRTNYLLMGLIALLGIAMLLWINREKFEWYRKIQMAKQMYNKDTMEELGKQFTSMFEVQEPMCPSCNNELTDGKCENLNCKTNLVDIPTNFKQENTGDEK